MIFSSKYLKDGDKISLLMTSNADGYSGRKIISNTLEVIFPEKEVKEFVKKENPKKEIRSHASGILKHKSIFWSKKGKRFVRVRGMALHKKKKNAPVCYKD